jgi:hypothetical protein
MRFGNLQHANWLGKDSGQMRYRGLGADCVTITSPRSKSAWGLTHSTLAVGLMQSHLHRSSATKSVAVGAPDA